MRRDGTGIFHYTLIWRPSCQTYSRIGPQRKPAPAKGTRSGCVGAKSPRPSSSRRISCPGVQEGRDRPAGEIHAEDQAVHGQGRHGAHNRMMRPIWAVATSHYVCANALGSSLWPHRQEGCVPLVWCLTRITDHRKLFGTDAGPQEISRLTQVLHQRRFQAIGRDV